MDFQRQQGGDIHATVTLQSGLPEKASSIVTALPVALQKAVKLTVSHEPIAKYFTASGGMAVQDDGVFECTSGWTVRSNLGVMGITTAGHCDGINEIVHPGVATHNMTHRAQHRGQWGDIEWKSTFATERPEFYATANQVRDVRSIEPRASISIGESVCVYGRSSNSRDCSRDVAATSMSCTIAGVFHDRLVRMDGPAAAPGDSGGGWSWNTRAYGSVIGVCGGDAIFSVADLYDEALGVRVSIQPFNWTPWLDRDSPSGTGDWEQRSLFPSAQVCSSPNDIQARRVGTSVVFTPLDPWPEIFLQFTASQGLVCRNADQLDNSCNDYEVRFLCP